jgi:hypothetical protein
MISVDEMTIVNWERNWTGATEENLIRVEAMLKFELPIR